MRLNWYSIKIIEYLFLVSHSYINTSSLYIVNLKLARLRSIYTWEMLINFIVNYPGLDASFNVHWTDE
jgi:hypothetical protein